MLQGSSLPALLEVIVALASAPGPSPRAVIRLAGPGCASLVALVWTSPQAGGAIQSPMPVRWTEGYFQPQGWSLRESIPTLARMWHTGTGYTSQEAVELHFTGAAPCVEAILTTLTALGARSAQPGEFTLRAFLAGRMDLVRAEALLGLTHAESVEELADALNQHAGGISEPMARMRENLLDFLADIEASLDFADEDIAQLPLEESLLRVTGLLAQAILLGKKMQGRGHHAGAFRVALVGRPNAGKSSLFNRITGAGHGQGALVSHEAGTTRDWLSRRIDLPGSNPLEWIDTAGWDVAGDDVQRQAQVLGRAIGNRADLVLVCIPVDSVTFLEERTYLLENAGKTLLVWTCADRLSGEQVFSFSGLGSDLLTSSLTGYGLEKLLERVLDEAACKGARGAGPHLARGREHVDQLIFHLRAAHCLILEEDPPELVALELRSAVDQLATILGTVYSDDLLGRVFSRFCIGK